MVDVPVVESFVEIPDLGPATVAIGTFDGVHHGHRYLLERAQESARARSNAFVVITFTPHPQLVLRPGTHHVELTPTPLKVTLLRALGPDLIVLLPFTNQFMSTSADDFMARLQEHVHLREMWMGQDFAFGHKRSGNVAYLIARGQRTGFSVHVISRVDWDGEPASSTRIRQALGEGDIALATELLGRPLRLRGAPRPARAAREHSEAGEGKQTDWEFWVPLSQVLPAAGQYVVQQAAPVDVRFAGSPGALPLPRGILTVPAVPVEGGDRCLLDLMLDGDLTTSGADDYRDLDVLSRVEAPAGNHVASPSTQEGDGAGQGTWSAAPERRV